MKENGFINIIYYNFSFLFLYYEGKQKKTKHKKLLQKNKILKRFKKNILALNFVNLNLCYFFFFSF